MKKLMALSGIVALSFAMAADANAWTRSSTASGPYGTRSTSVTGSCANGVCSRTATRTGPYGYSATRQRTASCANGFCSSTVTGTGPRGAAYGRSTTVTRY